MRVVRVAIEFRFGQVITDGEGVYGMALLPSNHPAFATVIWLDALTDEQGEIGEYRDGAVSAEVVDD